MALGTILDWILSRQENFETLEELRKIKQKKFRNLYEKAMALNWNFQGIFGNYARSILYEQPIGEFQKAFFWQDKNDVHRKGLLDFISANGKRIADIKTVSNIDRFKQNVERLGYYRQAGDYTYGARQEGYDADEFLWIVIETNFPWRIKVYKADEYKISSAMEENDALAKQLNERIKNNDWNFEQTQPETLEKQTETFIEESF